MKIHLTTLCLITLLATAYAETTSNTAVSLPMSDSTKLSPDEANTTGLPAEEVEEEIIVVTAPPTIIKAAKVAYSKGKSAEVLRLLEPFAEMNDSEAQYHLGQLYASKPHKMQDYKQACAWWQKAAKLDHLAAQNALAECYAKGRGIEQSNEKALEWWEKAAEQGNLEAQYTLGIIYHEGRYGVEKDNAIARKWFEQAASQGMYKAAAMANKLK